MTTLNLTNKDPLFQPEKLKILNEKKLPHKQYLSALCELFNISLSPITTDFKTFLGGFIVGEGNINVNAKPEKTARFGLYLDLEFSVTQHENNIIYLLYLLSLFHTGRIKYKSGSNKTYVYIVEARESLLEKIIPFWDHYILKRLSGYYKNRYNLFKKLLTLFLEKKHNSFSSFKEEMLPIWDKMRKQKSHKNESFKNLEDVIKYVDLFVEKKGEVLLDT